MTGRMRWGSATVEEARAFVAAARAFAAKHPHKAVRMFIFNLAKGIEHLAEVKEREQAGRCAGCGCMFSMCNCVLRQR